MTHQLKNQLESSITGSFKGLKDPRRTNKGNLCYPFIEIIFLVISAVISGSNDWTSIQTFGEGQLVWLRKYFPYKNGIPSHDTLGAIFSAIDNELFGKCFADWVSRLASICHGEIIAIDGKRLRGSYDTSTSKAAIHMVSAYAVEAGVCFAGVTTDKKSNEITAIPKLLNMLALKGCVVTIDAMGCQTKIVEEIIEKEADYVIAVKENQKELSEQVKKMFELYDGQSEEQTDAGHGRVEKRKCTVVEDLKFFDVKDQWKGIKSVLKIETERFTKITGKIQTETRYYISNLNAPPQRFNDIVRRHWHIENKLHWVLDVNFNEDKSRKRKDNSPANFNVISKIAMALLEKNNEKKSMRQKRYKAALDVKYREKVLNL